MEESSAAASISSGFDSTSTCNPLAGLLLVSVGATGDVSSMASLGIINTEAIEARRKGRQARTPP